MMSLGLLGLSTCKRRPNMIRVFIFFSISSTLRGLQTPTFLKNSFKKKKPKKISNARKEKELVN